MGNAVIPQLFGVHLHALVAPGVAAPGAQEMAMVVHAQYVAEGQLLLVDLLGQLLVAAREKAVVRIGVILQLKSVFPGVFENFALGLFDDILTNGEDRKLAAHLDGLVHDLLQVFRLEAVVYGDGDNLFLCSSLGKHRYEALGRGRGARGGPLGIRCLRLGRRLRRRLRRGRGADLRCQRFTLRLLGHEGIARRLPGVLHRLGDRLVLPVAPGKEQRQGHDQHQRHCRAADDDEPLSLHRALSRPGKDGSVV